MFKALMLFMPCVPSRELLLAMRDRYGSGRFDVFFVGSGLMYGHISDPELFTEKMYPVASRMIPEVWEFIELMGSFSYREIWMTHRYTYRDVVCSSHRPKCDVEHDLKSGGRDGPVYYSAYGDGTPYATLEDADNAAAMLKACIRETARLQGEMDPEKRAP